MLQILVLGAGRSSIYLIEYLLNKSSEMNAQIVVADMYLEAAVNKVGNNKNAIAKQINTEDSEQRKSLISEADIVVSLMPPVLHDVIAQDCLELKKHLFTASYVSEAIKNMREEVEKRNLLFFCEMGLDPGIDHMSALKMIDDIQAKGATIVSFKSYCGGLVAPESDDNPWHYKISWNPRNVVLAGKGTAQYYHDNKISLIPYNRIFTDIDYLQIPQLGTWEGYANRNSLPYRNLYHLHNTPNFIRGTIRHTHFCSSWNALVQLGYTDENCTLLDVENKTYNDITASLLTHIEGNSTEEKCCTFLNVKQTDIIFQNLQWLGIFSQNTISKKHVSLADILQQLMEEKWKLNKGDKDMVILHHEVEYMLDNKRYKQTSTLIDKGENEIKTSMAKLVGTPLALMVEAIAKGEIKEYTGVRIPVDANVYNLILPKLDSLGISFVENSYLL